MTLDSNVSIVGCCKNLREFNILSIHIHIYGMGIRSCVEADTKPKYRVDGLVGNMI